ncbi:MAG TPA: glycosyltransferase 87 family protein [Candidatus Acidoferrales bacterium]|nr:glycosyltransferase 87 family protein [Candidatus Acidoferrales bacterium]
MEKASYAMSASISLEETMVSFSLYKREIISIVLLLLVAFAVRVLLFPLQGYANDMGTFSYWFNTAATQGIRPFYTYVLENVGWIDYPPFNVYLFYAFGSLGRAFSSVDMSFFVKLAPTIFDVATSAVIFVFLRKHLTYKQALITTALYAFNPAIIFNVAVWGQFDAIYTFFLFLSMLLALKRKPELSAVVFGIAILTKPQSIALLPLIAVLIFKKDGVKRLLTSIAAFAATIFVVILPFEWSNPVTFLSDIYFGAYGNYQYTSINAFNFWGLFGLWIPDGNLSIVGWALFGSFAAFAMIVLYKRYHVAGDNLAIFAAFMLLFAFFMLPTRIHERYLFPAIVMLVLLVPFSKKMRLFYAGLTTTLFINQAYVLYYLNNNTFIPSGDLVVLAVSAINLILFIYASFILWAELKGRPTQAVQTQKSVEKLTQPDEGTSSEL